MPLLESSDHRGGEPGNRSRVSRFGGLAGFAFLLALGLISIVLLLTTYRIGERQIQSSVPLDRALSEIRQEISLSHLWLEEHLAGDDEVELQRDVLEPLHRARGLCRVLLEGGEVGELLSVELPVLDPDLRASVEELEAELLSFEEITTQRIMAQTGAGVGTPLDQLFDDRFRGLLAHTSTIAAAQEAEMVKGQDRARLLIGTIVALWLGLLLGTFVLSANRERRRRLAESALRRTEAQVRQVQKLEAVGRLAGGLAHDINNYLATITTDCELVKLRHGDTPALTRRVDAIIDTVFKASSLIRQLLAFSRNQPARTEVVSLNRVIRDLVEMLGSLTGDDVLIEVRLLDDLPRVEIDPAHAEQVLVNLVVNARQAMEQNGVVRIETDARFVDSELAQTNDVDSGEFVVLSVSDNGCGIPADARDKLFEPFFTTKRGAENSGLGLSTVYGIAKQNGGFVSVDSEVGRYTRFEVFLPRSARQEMLAAHTEAKPTDLPAATDRLEILLVEDNDHLRGSTREVLEILGHRVVAAADGEEALHLSQAHSAFDLVITDLVMPGMTGRELVEVLWQEGAADRALFVSGFEERVAVEDLLGRPGVEYLQKPFTNRVLAETLNRLTEEGGGFRATGG